MSMLGAFKARRRSEAQTDTTMETGEHSPLTNSSQSEPRIEDSKLWPSQDLLMSYVKPEQVKMLQNPMIAQLISRFSGDNDSLGKFLKLVELVQTDPVGTHEQLETIHQKIGEALAADHREHGIALSCASSAQSGPGQYLWNDRGREDDSGRYTEGGLALTLPEWQGVGSGQQATLPGSVGVNGPISETPVHEMGAE